MLSGPPALAESERPQVNPARAASTRAQGLYRGFQRLLALLAWITLNKQSPPSPTAFVWSTYSQKPPLLMGRLAHLYPEGPSETRCTSGWKNSSLRPPPRLPFLSTHLTSTNQRGSATSGCTPAPRALLHTNSKHPGKVTRETEVSTRQ